MKSGQVDFLSQSYFGLKNSGKLGLSGMGGDTSYKKQQIELPAKMVDKMMSIKYFAGNI